MKLICYVCDGQKLPLGIDFSFPSDDVLQHIVDFHLPLRCVKCLKMFESVEDLKDANKCCLPVLIEEHEPESEKEVADHEQNVNKDPKPDELSLSKINNMTRLKGNDFEKQESLECVEPGKTEKQRQTSTPFANRFTDTYSSSSIQISSINYMSTSSESDASPPIAVAARKAFVSPQRPPKSQQQVRSRPRLPVQATPLRQVMSKSIQRAMQQHGHYRESAVTLQQRKVSFNSTNSSEDRTTSLMKFTNESENPLDLRTTPARRRCSDEPPRENLIEDRDLIEFSTHIEIKQIEVNIRRSDIKSESSAMTTFKSCHSSIERSGSMPQLHLTPKIVGNGLMKKTISFETPNTIETTPGVLMPAVSRKSKEDDDDDDDEDDDVFFTPLASPYRPPFKRAVHVPSPIEEVSPDVVITIDESGSSEKENEGSKPNSHLWNFVSSVMKIASGKSEDSEGFVGSSDTAWSFNFKKPGFVQKAEDFFMKRSEEPDEQSSKRRRISSNAESSSGSRISPALKRQKIQARKPIGRMRNLT